MNSKKSSHKQSILTPIRTRRIFHQDLSPISRYPSATKRGIFFNTVFSTIGMTSKSCPYLCTLNGNFTLKLGIVGGKTEGHSCCVLRTIKQHLIWTLRSWDLINRYEGRFVMNFLPSPSPPSPVLYHTLLSNCSDNVWEIFFLIRRVPFYLGAGCEWSSGGGDRLMMKNIVCTGFDHAEAELCNDFEFLPIFHINIDWRKWEIKVGLHSWMASCKIRPSNTYTDTDNYLYCAKYRVDKLKIVLEMW